MTVGTLYARKEPTTCEITLQGRAQGFGRGPLPKDVQIYRDKEATQKAGRYPWAHNKPTRRNRYVMSNCARYRLEWLADLDEVLP
jgi:hypothetical protein